jgi:hypothetical protein
MSILGYMDEITVLQADEYAEVVVTGPGASVVAAG